MNTLEVGEYFFGSQRVKGISKQRKKVCWCITGKAWQNLIENKVSIYLICKLFFILIEKVCTPSSNLL